MDGGEKRQVGGGEGGQAGLHLVQAGQQQGEAEEDGEAGQGAGHHLQGGFSG